LSDELLIYTNPNTPQEEMQGLFEAGLQFRPSLLDWSKNNHTTALRIPKDGAIFYPGKIYLGATVERTYSAHYVPILDGRSSGARLGVTVHITGGFGDIGFNGRWTLEIRVEEPVRIYPGLKFCQVRFEVPHGDTSLQYNGKYQGSTVPQASKTHTEKT
jgi:dCTP deaminase